MIAIDAKTVYCAARRGTGKNLVDLYKHIAAMRPNWQFVMFHQSAGRDDPFEGIRNIRHEKVDIIGDRFDFWEHIRLPLACRFCGAKVLHSPANTAPRIPLTPLVVTIHDLIPLEPEFISPANRRWGKNVGAAARKARRVVTVSEFSKKQIVETFGVPADKVVVNYWAANAHYTTPTGSARRKEAVAKYGLAIDRPFVFGFGGADPRKNTPRIIEAWASLPQELRDRHQLLLVGITEPSLTRFTKKAVDEGVSDSCHLRGFAAEEDLQALMEASIAMCYTSLSEGFGLPVLDGFMCRTPVLTSDRTSMPEIAGKAAMLVDPFKADAIAGGIRRLLENATLRNELVAAGLERAKLFTWDATAAGACRVLEETLENA